MTDIAIRVENLSKLYKIGKARTILDFGLQIDSLNPKPRIANLKSVRLALWNGFLLQSLSWNMTYSTGLAFSVAAGF